MNVRRTALAALATLAALSGAALVACGRATPQAAAAEPAVAAAAAAAAQHEAGRAVYNFRCYFCHGYSGDAKTLAASFLAPPPRDFTAAQAASLNLQALQQAVREGRPGTAMRPFKNVLSERELVAVAAFVRTEFVERKAANTRYHTPANGWPAHERFEPAFDFATGRIALDAPLDTLDERQLRGRQLFLSTCISCHDRARVVDEGPVWSSRPVSFPRAGFVPGEVPAPPVDAVSSASVYAKHEVPPKVAGMSPAQRRGEQLFQANCAFCHGADGTGKNWIGQFMEPKARDLTQYTPQSMPPERLRMVIREGLPGTSMPAWQHVLKAREIDDLMRYLQRAMFAGPAAPAG